MNETQKSQWQERMLKNAEFVCGYESTLDTLIEEFGDTPNGAYAHLKKGLELIQKDLEEAGIVGHWGSDLPEDKIKFKARI